jgi:predicted transposase/invertase (TIGR01784 family)
VQSLKNLFFYSQRLSNKATFCINNQTRHYQTIFADPTYDATFKMIFGNEQHKKLLISLINNLLDFKNEQEVKEIHLITTEIPIAYSGHLKTAIDVRCKTSDGREILVEIQRKYKEYFLNRSQYYMAKAISVQLEDGQSALYNTKMLPVYVLAISRETLFKFKDDPSFEKTVVPTIKENNYIEFPGNKMHWKFFELSKFEKQYKHEIINKSHPVKLQWLDFLNKCATKKEIPEVDGLVQEAYKIMERAKWSRETIEAFELAIIEEKFEESEQEKYFQDGRIEGEAKGKFEEKIETAKKMLLENLDINLIGKITNLSIKEINDLKISQIEPNSLRKARPPVS